MSNTPFSTILSTLRQAANLTNRALARLADVPESFIAGLQSGNRRIGELQARKIAKALKLSPADNDTFVMQAVNTCTRKVLHEYTGYPAEILNLLARQLRRAGINAETIAGFAIAGTSDQQSITLLLADGKKAVLLTELTLS
jgi:transcriptional regulator with XRE-family HTH domain